MTRRGGAREGSTLEPTPPAATGRGRVSWARAWTYDGALMSDTATTSPGAMPPFAPPSFAPPAPPPFLPVQELLELSRPEPRVAWVGWGAGLLLMIVIGLLVGALPALRAMRLNIVDALAGR